MRLSDRAMDVCQALLPAGRRVGNKWLAGDVGNHPGDSLNVELDGPRAGLWSEMARIVGEVRPRFVWVENSPLLVSRGLAVVLGDLAEMGYDARWGVVGAHHAGAPHKRDRVWVLAYAERIRQSPDGNSSINGSSSNAGQADQLGGGGQMANPNRAQLKRMQCSIREQAEHANACASGWWQSEPDMGRVAHGVASRVDRLRCIGNGQVPQAMALAWNELTRDMKGQP